MDFSASIIIMAENRSDVVDFMMPFMEDHLSIAMKLPEENKNMIYFDIFDVCVKITWNKHICNLIYLQTIFWILNVNIVE